MKQKYILLLSSGLDSTVNAYMAKKQGEILLALTFNYAQRSAQREIQFAKKTCDHLGIKHQVIEVDFFKHFTSTSLVNTKQVVPENIAIDNLQTCEESARAVWVPNRNGIFINIAAGFAEGLGADEIVVGFNKEEAQTFPDNSQVYLDKVNESLSYSTLKKVKVSSFTTDYNKSDIVSLARDMSVVFEYIWSCYQGGEQPCETCESCLRYQRAIH